jgi:hypothetical protein
VVLSALSLIASVVPLMAQGGFGLFSAALTCAVVASIVLLWTPGARRYFAA